MSKKSIERKYRREELPDFAMLDRNSVGPASHQGNSSRVVYTKIKKTSWQATLILSVVVISICLILIWRNFTLKETTMPGILIPREAFHRTALGYPHERVGAGVDYVVTRELLQNSRDAGAKQVEFTRRETARHVIFECRDDGSGMDWDTLLHGMLTYAGTIKRAGAVGGFGKAKELLCFATAATEIRTRDLAVRIEGPNYEHIPGSGHVQGTHVTMYCDKTGLDRPCRLEPTAEGVAYLMKRCVFSGCDVTFNGEEVAVGRTSFRRREPVQTWSWGAKAYHFPTAAPYRGPTGELEILVCLRGLFMFSVAQPADAKGAIIIDIDRDSTDVMNDTRSGFAGYRHQWEISSWVESLAKSASSTLRQNKSVLEFTGKGLHLASTDPREMFKLSPRQFRPMTFGAGRTVARPRNTTRERLNDTAAWRRDFLLVNERGGHVPKRFLPQTMGPRVHKLLKLWAAQVGTLLSLNGRREQFGVGIVLSDEVAASYRKGDGGINWFLLNVVGKDGRLKKLTSNRDVRDILVSAGHEVSHLLEGGGGGHADAFVRHYDRQVDLLLEYQPMFRRLRREARGQSVDFDADFVEAERLAKEGESLETAGRLNDAVTVFRKAARFFNRVRVAWDAFDEYREFAELGYRDVTARSARIGTAVSA